MAGLKGWKLFILATSNQICAIRHKVLTQNLTKGKNSDDTEMISMRGEEKPNNSVELELPLGTKCNRRDVFPANQPFG